MGSTGGTYGRVAPIEAEERGLTIRQEVPARSPLRAPDKALWIARLLEEKKVQDILVLDVRPLNTLTDFLVIGTCESGRQMLAVVEHVEAQLGRQGVEPHHLEGLEGLRWVLMDYFDVVVHLFDPEAREYYALERLWGDAPRWEVSKGQSLSLESGPFTSPAGEE